MSEEKCLWCDSPAVALCDGWLGCVPVVEDGRECISFRTEQFICDAPMCIDHKTQIGHICGDEPNSMDVCPDHKEFRAIWNKWETAAGKPAKMHYLVVDFEQYRADVSPPEPIDRDHEEKMQALDRAHADAADTQKLIDQITGRGRA